MKSNWTVTENALVYNGPGYVGIIRFSYIENTIAFVYYLSEGDFNARNTKIRQTYNLSEAVGFIEKFFELDFDNQKEQFEMMTKEVRL